VSRQNTALCGSLTDQEEIVKFVSCITTDKFTINNCASRWIFDVKSISLLKEPLVDSLVYNNEGNLRLSDRELLLY
jgi:hypothetical protein